MNMNDFSNLIVRLVNVKSHKALYNPVNDNNKLGVYGGDDSNDQWWKLEPVQGQENVYKIRNVATNSVVFNAPDGRSGVYGGADCDDQWWRLEAVDTESNIYKLRNVKSNNVIYSAPDDRFGFYGGADCDDQWWKLQLRMVDITTHLDSIDFSSDPFDKNKGQLDSVWTVDIENPSDATISRSISKTVAQESTFEIALTQTLTLGASAEFKAKIPFIGSAKTTVSAELSLSAGQTWQSSEMEKYNFSETITVPLNISVRAIGQLRWVKNISIPYTIRFWVSGKVKDTNVKLTAAQIKMFLIENGFTGIIIDEQQQQSLLALRE